MADNIKKLYDQEQVDVMTWLRFPLILGVVIVHCNLFAQVTAWEGVEPEWPKWLIYIFNNFVYLTLPARVPTLFIISGYFFFRSQKKRDFYFFIDKYKRRIHSLLIPYISWNTIAIIVLFIRFNIIYEDNYTFIDYMSGYWDFIPRNNNTPANMPLWFIRDLMVVSLIIPLFYGLLKKRISGIILITIFSICYIADIKLPIEALLFFSIGTYIAIHNIDFTKIPNHIGIISVILYFPLQIIIDNTENNTYISNSFVFLVTVIKILAAFYIVSLLFRKEILKPTQKLTKISFLLYAIHGIIVGVILKSLYIILDSNNPFILLGIFITTPCIIIGITFLTYNLLSKYTPWLKKILLGNRN